MDNPIASLSPREKIAHFRKLALNWETRFKTKCKHNLTLIVDFNLHFKDLQPIAERLTPKYHLTVISVQTTERSEGQLQSDNLSEQTR
jgi:hypothetical protein